MLDIEKIADAIISNVREHVAKSVDPLKDKVAELQKIIDELPEPEKGADGESPSVDEVVKELVKHIPAPIHGKDGESVSMDQVKQMLESVVATWALDFEKRAQDTLQKSIDRIEKPKNGIDGFGFDDMDVQHDGERCITLKFTKGERVKEFSFVFPTVIDRGVYKEGTQYKYQDGATLGGSFWIAQKDTSDKPGEGSPDWRLSVKRGRDGKDGKNGIDRTAAVKL